MQEAQVVVVTVTPIATTAMLGSEPQIPVTQLIPVILFMLSLCVGVITAIYKLIISNHKEARKELADSEKEIWKAIDGVRDGQKECIRDIANLVARLDAQKE